MSLKMHSYLNRYVILVALNTRDAFILFLEYLHLSLDKMKELVEHIGGVIGVYSGSLVGYLFTSRDEVILFGFGGGRRTLTAMLTILSVG